MNKHKFLRGSIIITAGVLLGVIVLFLVAGKPVPAEAQAQQLFELYFEMDQVRQDSAQIFAELIEVNKNPEQVGTEKSIGSKPTLSSQEELIGRLKENQISVEKNLATIDANKFTDPEVKRRYDEVRTFYTTLFEFEDMALTELALAENNEERQLHLATTLFEGVGWPTLLAQDAHLLNTLTSLAELHSLEFTPLSYENIFRERLIELRRPIISDEVNTIVYPFTVKGTAEHYVMLNVAFDIPLSDKIEVSLEDPRGHTITSDQFAKYTASDNSPELNFLSYISRTDSVIIVKFFPSDPSIELIPGDWKLYVTAPVGSSMVIGMIEL